MTTSLQLKTGTSSPHRNRYLFSDHYLENILPDDPRWEQALAEAEGFCDWLRELYADEQDQLPEYNEDQLEDQWFKPILRKLGHTFQTRASVPGLGANVKYPDYVFFPDEAARQKAVSAQGTEEYAANALAVGEVKRWDVPLGKKRKGGGPSFEDQNPSWQIDRYVRDTGLAWGILTNGRLWRLVHVDSSHRLNVYYEVDLIDLLDQGTPGLMRYFVLFFRQAAFRPDARGRIFLDDVLAASNAYAIELEEDLEQNVYQALERLMQGFLDLSANRLGPENLRQIYDNSLYLLYRLLFILYGESRGLLPLQNDRYRTNYSLTRIKEEIAGLEATPAPMTTLFWSRLKTLFHIINGDDPQLNRALDVPRYNGGLFDPRLHRFLEEKAVGDRALVEAIDLLSRRATETADGRHPMEFVDYRTLGVRHLGSIYEGLLEYRPRLAEEPMVAVGDEWVPAEKPLGSSETLRGSAGVVDRRAPGEVYLETDRGERKATGSYYTPQYIVEYIVEHTLGPLVEEARERVKARAESAEDGQALVDEILDLKCLDPAMGSGHFLVEATEFLARALATDPYVETEQVAEEDLTYWKRRVVERCIYGVDKNPLAVELAKLSLWLATVAADRPLSFLDHHLKCGDSLIGARVEDLDEVPPVMLSKKALKERKARYDAGVRQANLFETRLIEKLPVVMGRILEITEVESKDYDTVRAKEAADRAVRELKAPFEAVANLWTSAYFGNQFVNGEYDEALMQIGQPDELMELPAVRRAKAMADERRFFHWELAFPEVFYDEHGKRLGERAGFDTVVGNPPWIAVDNLPEQEKSFLRQFYQVAQKFDLAHAFVDLAAAISRTGGRISLVIPEHSWIGEFQTSFRLALMEKTRLAWVASLKEGNFSDVANPASMFGAHVVRGVDPSAEFLVGRAASPADLAPLRGYEVRISALESDVVLNTQNEPTCLYRVFFDPRLLAIRSVLHRVEWKYLNAFTVVSDGVKTADVLKEVMVQDPPPSVRSRYCKALRSGVKIPDRYGVPQWDRWYILREDHIDEYRSRSGFSYDSPRRMYCFAADEKIIMRQTEPTIMATLDREGYRFPNSIFTAALKTGTEMGIRYLLALVNSYLIREYYLLSSQVEGTTKPQLYINQLKSLPIRRIDFTTPADEREQLVAAGITDATEWIETTEKGTVYSADSVTFSAFSGSNVGRWLDERLSADPEQADVIHDLLAHLAEQMIAMHKEKQEHIEAFWLDLEGVTDGEAFEALHEHGKWESSLWKAQDCRPFVDQESRSTRHLDESLGWNEGCFKAFVKMLTGRVANLSDVVGVYRKHHPAYRRLVQRIEATDRLIDRIVYRLYGLTDEEIAIVEE